MADAEGKRPNRPGDNFVSKLVQDPANPPELIRMTGYKGASPEKDHIRLYANPELSAHWDIPAADVLHEQAVPTETDPLGAVTLWIKRDSKIIPNKGAKGDEQEMHTLTPYCYPGMGGFAAAPQGQAQLLPTLNLTVHNSITPVCHSIYLAYCVPSPLPYYCHSPLPYCVPRVSPVCPTQPTIGTFPTQPTTFGTYQPQPQYQAQAQPQFEAAYQTGAAAPQGITQTITQPSLAVPCTISPIPIHCTQPPPSPIPVHCTISPIPIHCTQPPPSPIPVHCTISPIPIHCTIPYSPQPVHCTIPVSPQIVHCTQASPLPQCVISPACTIVASPNCPNTHPTTFPTTQPTTVGPGTEAGGGFGAQMAAPQQQAAYRPTTVLTATAFPSEILYQCTHVTVTHVTPASPYCTYPTVTYTYPTITRTYGGGGYGGY